MHIGLSTELITEYLPVLSSSPLFRDLSEDQLRNFLIAPNLTIANIKKNSFIAIAGDPMEGIGILLKGHAHLTRENVLGQRTIMTDLTPSAMFGEAILFTDMPNWPATIQTTEDSTVLFVPKAAFTTSFNNCDACQVQILTNLLTRKVHYLSLKGMRGRIFAYFDDLYTYQKQNPIRLPHNRQEMADVLNVSRTSLSRELGRLQDEKIIEFEGKKVKLLDVKAINEYSF